MKNLVKSYLALEGQLNYFKSQIAKIEDKKKLLSKDLSSYISDSVDEPEDDKAFRVVFDLEGSGRVLMCVHFDFDINEYVVNSIEHIDSYIEIQGSGKDTLGMSFNDDDKGIPYVLRELSSSDLSHLIKYDNGSVVLLDNPVVTNLLLEKGIIPKYE